MNIFKRLLSRKKEVVLTGEYSGLNPNDPYDKAYVAFKELGKLELKWHLEEMEFDKNLFLFLSQNKLAGFSLRSFAFEHCIKENIRSSYFAKIIVDEYFNTLKKILNEQLKDHDNNIFRKIEANVALYKEAMEITHENGPAWQIGKVYCKLLGKERDPFIATEGSIIFGEYYVSKKDVTRELNELIPDEYIDSHDHKSEEDIENKDTTKDIESSTYNADVYFNRGINNLYDKDEYEKAIIDFNKAIELDESGECGTRTDGCAYHERGNAYSYIDDYDRAIKDYNKAIALNPEFARAFLNRGNTFTKKGNYDTAIKDYDRVIELNPKYDEAFFWRGHAYFKKQDNERAIKDYDMAIEINPKMTYTYYYRGNAYMKIDQIVNAINDYRKYLELNPHAKNKERVQKLIEKICKTNLD